jgi:hypothetical protein
MPAGRPTEFKPEYISTITELAASGSTDAEIADHIGVSKVTLWRWKKSHPEICSPLKEAKDIADERVVASLYKRAVGFEHDAVKVSFDKDGKPIYAPYREYVVPDTTAAIFWLKNRRDKEWRDKTQQDVNLGIQVVMVQPPVEQVKERPALKPAFDEKLVEGE